MFRYISSVTAGNSFLVIAGNCTLVRFGKIGIISGYTEKVCFRYMYINLSVYVCVFFSVLVPIIAAEYCTCVVFKTGFSSSQTILKIDQIHLIDFRDCFGRVILKLACLEILGVKKTLFYNRILWFIASMTRLCFM